MLVISRERINQVLPVVNAIPLTSRKAAARCIYPNEVLLPTGTAGLRVDSIALCYQIRTLDRGRLAQDLGELQKRACVGTSSRRFASSWSCEPFERADQVAHTDA